mgnify:FL=1
MGCDRGAAASSNARIGTGRARLLRLLRARAWRLWAARHARRERPGHWAPSHGLGCSRQSPAAVPAAAVPLGAQELLRSGVGVLYAAPHAVLLSPPAVSLHADSDLETLSHGWEEDDVRGHIFGSDDPPMGWGRCAERGLALTLTPGPHPMRRARVG